MQLARPYGTHHLRLHAWLPARRRIDGRAVGATVLFRLQSREKAWGRADRLGRKSPHAATRQGAPRLGPGSRMEMTVRHLTVCLSMRKLLSVSLLTAAVAATSAAQEPGVVVFKSRVEQVAVAALVRDSRGRLVTDLKSSDFELFDDGQKRTLTNVWSEPSPASVAILMDASGSMAPRWPGRARRRTRWWRGLSPVPTKSRSMRSTRRCRKCAPFRRSSRPTDGLGRDEGVRRHIAVGRDCGNRAENF